MITITIKEAIFGSENTTDLKVYLPKKNLTLTELIAAKVKAKVKIINADLKAKEPDHRFMSIKEHILNRPSINNKTNRLKEKLDNAQIDPEKAVYEALAGFQQNAFLMVIVIMIGQAVLTDCWQHRTILIHIKDKK